MKLQRPLVSLITFCASAVIITALGLVVVFAAGTAVLAVAHPWNPSNEDLVSAATENQAADHTDSPVDAPNTIIFAGVVTDDHCVARHDMGSASSPAECTRTCVREGGHYSIVSGSQHYLLTGRDDLTMLAGERVTVTGSLTGHIIKIGSIAREE